MIFSQNKHKRLFVGLSIVLAAFGLVWILNASGNPSPGDIQNANPPAQNINPSSTPATSSESRYVLLEVPFFSQAPNANWEDPRQQDGCEEASLLMAWLWVTGKSMTKDQAEAEIIAMSEFEKTQYGNYLDLDAQDTAKLMKDYYGYEKTRVEENISLDDIKNELRQGRLVLVPANGQKLGNPNFSGDGPYTHMVVVRGFDDAKRQIITNDPGTRNGKLYRYDYDVFYNAMVNYPSGHHEPQEGRPKAMIVVSK